ncbi:hypothetical protein CFC21_104402 [Triticum aestivum]|uniref:VWFA domain-containing protein n=2 Tax=Triticum aestivum TaxID=4565 RepID=A0A3B6SPU4_WHEAT|nr:uncharacterized protein LOC123162725 [Triticum aestivum]KAF7103413.1 hypothetical protein CFC21_104402 [Triticum aestivum]
MSSDFDEDQDVPYAHPRDGPPLLDRADMVRFRWHASDRAPLHENRQQVLLEVHDASSSAAGDRLGIDLVAVLDVSKSMRKKDRLGKMKTAMHFVINKLGPKDRLSIVKFSEEAERLCPLLSVTPDNKPHLMDIVDGLQVIDPTNIRDGLETALGVLGRRRISGGRVASIFLLSDGDENIGHATNVDVSDVPVYTFGFGTDFDPKVLDEIARRSKGGTFNFVDDGENMTEPFSQILGGLLSIVVQDLKLIVSPQPGDSILEDVDSRLYQQTRDDNSGAVIVHFGDLFAGEIRRVIAHIRLPAVGQKKNATAIIAQCSYSVRGQPFYSRRLPVPMRRTPTGSADPSRTMPVALRTERARRHHVTFLDEVRTMADGDDLHGAQGKLVEARNDLAHEQSNPMIDFLRATLDKLLGLITSPGQHAGFRAYLRSLRTSHDRERVAATGDVKGVRLFETRHTSAFRGQAKRFEKQATMGHRPPAHHDSNFNEEDDDTNRLREREEGRTRMERPVAVEARGGPWKTWWGDDDKGGWRRRSSARSTSACAWVLCILCVLLVIGAIVLGVLLFAVYNHKMPYLAVADAQLGALQYAGKDGTVQNLQLSIAFLAINKDSRADASFSRVNLALKLQGVDMLLFRAPPFVVPPDSSMPLQYNDVVSTGRRLDKAGMRSMDKSLNAGVVPFDLHGKVRTRGNTGIFQNTKFWTRFSCRLHFFFPGNGTVIPADRRSCRSRWP